MTRRNHLFLCCGFWKLTWPASNWFPPSTETHGLIPPVATAITNRPTRGPALKRQEWLTIVIPLNTENPGHKLNVCKTFSGPPGHSVFVLHPWGFSSDFEFFFLAANNL